MEEQLTIYTVLERLLGKCYGDFDQLYQTLSGGAQQGKGDASKISEIQDFLAKYRVLFIRALILVKWSKSIPELHKCFHIITQRISICNYMVYRLILLGNFISVCGQSVHQCMLCQLQLMY